MLFCTQPMYPFQYCEPVYSCCSVGFSRCFSVDSVCGNRAWMIAVKQTPSAILAFLRTVCRDMSLLLAIKASPFIPQFGSFIFTHLSTAYLHCVHVHHIWVTLLVSLAKCLSPLWAVEAIILTTPLCSHYCLGFNPVCMLYLRSMGPLMEGLWAWNGSINDHVC